MPLPDLTLGILTYKRPWYALLTLTNLINHIQYDGNRKFVVSDGGSPDWQLEMYQHVLKDHEHKILVTENGDVAQMMNLVAEYSDEAWILALDDFVPMWIMNVSHDVEFLQQNEDVGHIRYANMNGWDTPEHKVYAELRNIYREHYWVIDKGRSTSGTLWTMGFSMIHRRMWDTYGPIAKQQPHQPGNTENQMNRQFRAKAGPTIAVPMRIGQESGMTIPVYQPIAHIGHVRTDEYTNLWNQRWGAV